jgi:hypothetical protein
VSHCIHNEVHCRFGSISNCYYGANCKFRHVVDDSVKSLDPPVLPTVTSGRGKGRGPTSAVKLESDQA